jgi:hypothetical protein
LRKTPVKRYTKNDFERFMNTGQVPKDIRNGTSKIKTHNTTTYKVEKGVPIPNHRVHRYPLLELEVGDSFVVPINETKHVRSAIGRAQRKNKALCFITRTINGRGRAGKQLRVWRIAS